MIKIRLFEKHYSEKEFINLLNKFNDWILADKEAKWSVDYILGEGLDQINYYLEEWNKFLDLVDKGLKKYGILVDQLDLRITMEDSLLAQIDYPPKYDTTRVYPKNGTMGWILHLDTGKVEFFEGSDEPTNEDLIFEDAFTEPKWIKLYSCQNADFVKSWKEKGIPKDTFFAINEWVAERYWHPEGNDILISIELWNKELQRVDDQAYSTKGIIKNFQKLKILKYL